MSRDSIVLPATCPDCRQPAQWLNHVLMPNRFRCGHCGSHHLTDMSVIAARTAEAGPVVVQESAPQVMRPSVGRIVHYVAYGTPGGEYPSGACRAAVVTEVTFVPEPDETLEEALMKASLCVLNPTGFYFTRAVFYSEDREPGTWHWPERSGA